VLARFESALIDMAFFVCPWLSSFPPNDPYRFAFIKLQAELLAGGLVRKS